MRSSFYESSIGLHSDYSFFIKFFQIFSSYVCHTRAKSCSESIYNISHRFQSFSQINLGFTDSFTIHSSFLYLKIIQSLTSEFYCFFASHSIVLLIHQTIFIIFDISCRFVSSGESSSEHYMIGSCS